MSTIDKGVIHVNLSEVSIAELLEGLEGGHFTSVQLVQAYIARIHELQPRVHAVNEINPDAVNIARKRDLERAEGNVRGRLHGIPILVKDVLCTNDRMKTTAGFLGLVDSHPGYEATTVSKLRAEGAIILGKTSLSEWLNCRAHKKIPTGWSPVGGQPMSIFHDNQDPGGSSSGSAIAAALGLGAAALASETAGSIASPANVSGVVGVKPTAALSSRHGAVCGSEWQDGIGVMAQNVLDAALVLSVIFGYDEMDPSSGIADPRDEGQVLQRPPEGTDFREYCQETTLRGMRVAVPRHIIKPEPFVEEAFEEALEVMRSMGATIVDDAVFPAWSLQVYKESKEAWNQTRLTDFRLNLSKFLGSLQTNTNNLHTVEDIIKYIQEEPLERPDDYQWQDLQKASDWGKEFDKDPTSYQNSHQLRLRMGMETGRILDKYDCDVLAAPFWTETPAPIGGNPQINVPLPAYPADWPAKYEDDGLVSMGPNIPTSILFVGRRWDDARVLGAAYAFEKATKHRSNFKPIIKSSIGPADIKTDGIN